MKSRNTSMFIGVALLAIFGLPGVMKSKPAVGVKANADSGARTLEGTWRVNVTVRDCVSGGILRTFPALLTFAQGGTLTETTAGFPPAVRTPGHGFWRHTGDHSYAAVSEAFLFNGGTWTATQRLTQSIEIGDNPDELTSTATGEIIDTSGNVTSTCATAVATRLE